MRILISLNCGEFIHFCCEFFQKYRENLVVIQTFSQFSKMEMEPVEQVETTSNASSVHTDKKGFATTHKSRQTSTGTGKVDKRRRHNPNPRAPPDESPEFFGLDVEDVVAEPGADQFTTYVPTLPVWIKPRTYKDLENPMFVPVTTDIKAAIRELNKLTNTGKKNVPFFEVTKN